MDELKLQMKKMLLKMLLDCGISDEEIEVTRQRHADIAKKMKEIDDEFKTEEMNKEFIGNDNEKANPWRSLDDPWEISKNE